MRWVGVTLLSVAMTVPSAMGQRPEWEIKAGGKMAFDVASVRLSKPGTSSPESFPITADDGYFPSRGVFNADFPLSRLISFAYKLGPDKSRLMEASLPKWALDDAYTVRAKTDNANATKDQMRLMVQALLADRFKLVLHAENRELPVFALTLMKPGKTGPKLRPHSEGPVCGEQWPDAIAKDAAFPFVCDIYQNKLATGHMVMIGSRNTALESMAPYLSMEGAFGRSVVDRTGLEGRWDFTLEWLPEPKPGAAPDPDAQGPTFLEAMHEQLGLKVEPARASLEVLVVDRVERPAEN